MSKSLTPAIMELERVYDCAARELFPNTEQMLENKPVISIRSRGRRKESTHSWYKKAVWEEGGGEKLAEITLASEAPGEITILEIGSEILTRMCEHSAALGEKVVYANQLDWLRELNLDIHAFEMAQVQKKRKKQPTRMKLWECACGIKVRSTRDLSNIKCLDCNAHLEKQE